MKINFSKGLFKKVALALAGVAALTGVGFGVKAIVDYTKNDLKTISPSFSVGNLGSDGKYVTDESTLYTKDAFACNGLQIKLDFDNEINYQIYYYDDLDNFIESTEIFSGSYNEHTKASHARIVIFPLNDDDNKISFIERLTYSGQVTVKVSKNQELRFTTFNGKYMEIVDDISQMYYTAGVGLEYYDGVANWSAGAIFTCTSTTILKVKGGEQISFVPLIAGFEPSYKVFEFSDFPTNSTLLTNSGAYVNSSDVTALNKNTQYILISLLTSADNPFTEKQVLTLSASFVCKK